MDNVSFKIFSLNMRFVHLGDVLLPLLLPISISITLDSFFQKLYVTTPISQSMGQNRKPFVCSFTRPTSMP